MQEKQSFISNIRNHFDDLLQVTSVFPICQMLICFGLLTIIFLDQYQDIQSILPYTVPLCFAVIIGLFSRIYPKKLVLAFYFISLIGIQILLQQIHSIIQEGGTSSTNFSQKNQKIGMFYYVLGITHTSIISSMSNILSKLIFLVLSFVSTILIISSLTFNELLFSLSLVFILSMLVLLYFKESQRNKMLSYFSYIFHGFKENFKQSCDSIIVKSISKYKYDILFSENSLSKFFQLNRITSSSKPSNSTRNRILTTAEIFKSIQLNHVQIFSKTSIGNDQWQEISSLEQNKEIQNYNLDFVIQFLYSKRDIWQQRVDEQTKSYKLTQRRYQFGQRDLQNSTCMKKQRDQLVCKFQINNYNTGINNHNQNDNQVIQVYEGKIYINRNPYTKDKYLQIFLARQQNCYFQDKVIQNQTRVPQIDSLNFVSVSISSIKDILNIPLRQSINEILAKITMIQNNKKNSYVKQTSFGNNLEYSHNLKYQKQLRMLHSSSAKSIPNQVKIDNNLTILYQNILYLQSILQYQHSYMQTQFLHEEIQIKIQKFSLQEFLDELKDIITTQFYSYLVSFNLDDQSREKQNVILDDTNSYKNQIRLKIPISSSTIYMYTDLSILRLIIIIICEKVVKASNFEKYQSIALQIKDEGQNNISFTLKFPQINKKLFINSYLQQSLIQLGSNTGFEQTWQLNEQESIIIAHSNNNNNNNITIGSPAKVPKMREEFDLSKYDDLQELTQENEKVNQIKFIILQDLSQKKKNLDAIILNKLRQKGDIEDSVLKSPDCRKFDQSFKSNNDTTIRPRNPSKYRHYKLEYLAESLNFDQYETVYSGTTEPYDNYETETNLQIKKPSIFQQISQKNSSFNDSNSTSKQNQIRVVNPNKSQKEINNTKTVFIILEQLQIKDEIEEMIQNKFNKFINIYEFKSLLECNEKLKNEFITPDILVLDANNFINSQTSYFSSIFKQSLKNSKGCFTVYIFNNEQEEQQELQNIFYQPQFKVIKYSDVSTFLDV